MKENSKSLYRYIRVHTYILFQIIWVRGNWRIFETVTDRNVKQLENGKETH
jgi:hypothetical protein